MLAKIISAGAVLLLLAGGALASGSTVSAVHTQQSATSEHNIYAGHQNSPAQGYAASTASYGYHDTQGSHALGGGPG
jgi:hypothetical protein